MRYIEQLTKYVGNFVSELVYQGVTNAVISPGSRSTPLAMMLTEHEKIKEWVLVDERSAGFFALGLARATNKPVILVCTSGTAAANYYPAIIEAYEQRIPLIVLTADRPHELRDTGASQTMNQIHLYGHFVKWFHEMALPEDTDVMLHYVRGKAARAYMESTCFGNFGPVHLNFPLREPLVPDVSLENKWGEKQTNFIESYHGEKTMSEQSLQFLVNMLANKERGLIVCGPQFDETLGEKIVSLSELLQIPILADPLSQLRAFAHDKANVIDGFDTILFTEEERRKLSPEYIIRFGAMPISKRYLHYVNENPNTIQIIVEDVRGVREPTNSQATFVYANSHLLCETLCNEMKHRSTKNDWLQQWQEKNTIVQTHLKKASNKNITEGEAVRTLFDVIPNQSGVFIGNSMPIRDTDTFFSNTDKSLKLYGNRGVSGIEGIASTSLGIVASNRHAYMTLVVGDLSFYHDLNGLFASKKYNLSLTILLINNDGGGIFSFLPQAIEGNHFETLFGTPMGMDFQHAANLYEANYAIATNKHDLQHYLHISYESKGLHIIEVQTNRDENVRWHKQLWQKIHEELAAK